MSTRPHLQYAKSIEDTLVAKVLWQVCVGAVFPQVIQEVRVCPSSKGKDGNHFHKIVPAPFLQEGDAHPYGMPCRWRRMDRNSVRPPWLTAIIDVAGGSRRSR